MTPFRHVNMQIREALLTVQRILDTTRSPKLANNQDHSYQDKYDLAVMLTNTATAAVFNVLERMGMNKAHLKQMVDAVRVQNTSVTMRFHLDYESKFLYEKSVEVAPDTEDVATVKVMGRQASFSRKVVKKVKEFHWEQVYTYKVLVYSGAEPNDSSICFQSRTGTMRVATRARDASFQMHAGKSPTDINLTWLFQQLQDGKCTFDIDRSDAECRTPRRNKDIDAAAKFWDSVNLWTSQVVSKLCELEATFRTSHRPVIADDLYTKVPRLDSVTAKGVFVPVLPLMDAIVKSREEEHYAMNQGLVQLRSTAAPNSTLLSLTDITKFLDEQCRSLDEAADKLTQCYVRGTDSISAAEAVCVLYCLHIGSIQKLWLQGVDYIEDMLREQLIAAIGKVIDSSDFNQFLTHHYCKVFSPQYAPRSFCYAIRRPNHYPDGILSIENMKEDLGPIQSMVRVFPNLPIMQIPINAATTIDMEGPVFLHGWLSPSFASPGPQEFKLVGRARQFSSFLMMIGIMATGERFHPKDAIILQNKDEVIIPLLLRDVPSAKEFKDAISSLSPEQQQFATSYRSMQLESSMFGVCIVQLKPQLEVLLGLPDGALTKEIKLTQDLMSLFVEYQIPSDLLSYDGLPTASTGEKVSSVKAHVLAVMNVIETTRTEKLNEAKQKHRIMSAGLSEDHCLPMNFFGGVEFEITPCCGVPDSSKCGDESFMPDDVEDFPTVDVRDVSTSLAIDFTAMPKKLNQRFEQYDEDNAVRTTTIETKDNWKRKRQENILTSLEESRLSTSDRQLEKNKAFDLLDAVSRSGSLPLIAAELHVIMGVTHSFEESVMETVIQKNKNPIEKMERSALILAATVHNLGIPDLIADGALAVRLGSELPLLGMEETEDTAVDTE